MMNNETTIKVWDILVRLFHWFLVIFFTIAYFTAEEENPWHIYAGYTVLGLLLFRIVWGLVGTQYARFSNFIYSPSHVVHYIKSLLEKNPKHYTGHNPAGGWMIIALLLSLTVVTVSGLKLYAEEEGLGPLARGAVNVTLINNAYAEEEDDDDNKKAEGNKSEEAGEGEKGEEFWEEIHEASTNFMLFLIFIHISGVLVSSRLEHENLIKAMITGRKKPNYTPDSET
jgi:cytochrome b